MIGIIILTIVGVILFLIILIKVLPRMDLNKKKYLDGLIYQIEHIGIEGISNIQDIKYIASCNSKEDIDTVLSTLYIGDVVYSNHLENEIITQWVLFEIILANNAHYIVIFGDSNELWLDQFIYEIMEIPPR